MYSTILLVAGKSSRMGRMKALLPWSDSYLLKKQIEQIAHSISDEIVVVTGYQHKLINPGLIDISKKLNSLAQIKIVYNENYSSGKTSSIRKGLEHLASNSEGVAIVGVDQPVLTDTLNSLFSNLMGREIRIPVMGGKKGHPPVFSCAYFEELKQISEEHQGLRHVIKTNYEYVRMVEVDQPQVLLNLNDRDDYMLAISMGMDLYD